MNKRRMAVLSATGTGQKRTLPAVREGNICDIVGIHGRDPGKVEKIAAKFEIPVHSTDAAQLLDSVKPDFAFIGSPPFLHLEQIRLCADRGIPVLCEKPLCVSVEDAEEIKRLSAESGIDLRVAHHLRHQPAVDYIRKIVTGGELGVARRASLQWAFWVREEATSNVWKSDVTKGGAHAFFDSGIHAIDMMMYLLPRPNSVAAMGTKSRFANSLSTVSALFDCSGVIAELNTSQALKCPMNAMAIDFEDGTLHVPNAFGEKSIGKVEIIRKTGLEEVAFEPMNPYGQEVADFLDVLDGQESRGTTLEEAIQGVTILNAIELSCAEARSVKL